MNTNIKLNVIFIKLDILRSSLGKPSFVDCDDARGYGLGHLNVLNVALLLGLSRKLPYTTGWDLVAEKRRLFNFLLDRYNEVLSQSKEHQP